MKEIVLEIEREERERETKRDIRPLEKSLAQTMNPKPQREKKRRRYPTT